MNITTDAELVEVPTPDAILKLYTKSYFPMPMTDDANSPVVHLEPESKLDIPTLSIVDEPTVILACYFFNNV